MILLDIEVRLAAFDLRVRAELGAAVTAVVGPSGAGKTSLLEAIAGLRRASGRIRIGDVSFLDTDSGVDLPPERRRVGYVPQDGALFPHLSARGNIEFASRDRERFHQLVEVLGIESLLERFPASLSGGERQRVAIARALMLHPRALLLDEPLAAVDPGRKERVLSFLRRLRATVDVPMIYVTHHPVEALALADEALALDRGRVVAQGPAAEVLQRSDVGGTGALENVIELVEGIPEPALGIVRALTAEGMPLAVPLELATSGWPLLVRVSGEDVVLFTRKPEAISARNILEGSILSLRAEEGIADLLVGTATPLRIRLTAGASAELGLRRGLPVWVALRTRSIRPLD